MVVQLPNMASCALEDGRKPLYGLYALLAERVTTNRAELVRSQQHGAGDYVVAAAASGCSFVPMISSQSMAASSAKNSGWK